MFSNTTEVVVTQIVVSQYIVASLSLSVNDQFTEAYQFTKIHNYVSEAKAFQKRHRQSDFCICSK